MTPSPPSDNDPSGVLELQALAARTLAILPAPPKPVRLPAARLGSVTALRPSPLSMALRASETRHSQPPQTRRRVTLARAGLLAVAIFGAAAAGAVFGFARRAPVQSNPAPPPVPSQQPSVTTVEKLEPAKAPVVVAQAATAPAVPKQPRQAAAPIESPRPAPRDVQKSKPAAIVRDDDPFDKPVAKPVTRAHQTTGEDDPFDKPGSVAATPPSNRAETARQVDRLLANPVAAPAPSPAPAPERAALSRSQVTAVMAALSRDVRVCDDPKNADTIVPVQITVAEDGQVTRAAISGPLAGTAVGQCVQAQVTATRFPLSRGLRFDYRLSVR